MTNDDDTNDDDAAAAARHMPRIEPGTAAPGLPADAMIIVPVRNFVLFPGMVMPVTVGRQKSITAAQQAVREHRPVGILKQRDAETEDPTGLDTAPHGHGRECHALHHRAGRRPSPRLPGRAALPGARFLGGWPFMVARVMRIPEPTSSTPRSKRASCICAARRWKRSR